MSNTFPSWSTALCWLPCFLRFEGILAPMSDTNRLNDYLAAWELSHPRLLTQTITSHIYTVTHGAETCILKLLTPAETEEQRGALALRYFDGCGAVRLLRY